MRSYTAEAALFPARNLIHPGTFVFQNLPKAEAPAFAALTARGKSLGTCLRAATTRLPTPRASLEGDGVDCDGVGVDGDGVDGDGVVPVAPTVRPVGFVTERAWVLVDLATGSDAIAGEVLSPNVKAATTVMPSMDEAIFLDLFTVTHFGETALSNPLLH